MLENGNLILEKRIKLLECIDETGSISLASKKIGMTYKAAWEALQNMNNLSDETLIQTSKGDNQNGTKLTAYAKDLIRAHKEVMKYHALLNKELEQNLLSKNFKYFTKDNYAT